MNQMMTNCLSNAAFYGGMAITAPVTAIICHDKDDFFKIIGFATVIAGVASAVFGALSTFFGHWGTSGVFLGFLIGAGVVEDKKEKGIKETLSKKIMFVASAILVGGIIMHVIGIIAKMPRGYPIILIKT